MINENLAELMVLAFLYLFISKRKLFVFESMTLIIKENSVNGKATLNYQHDFALLIDPLRFHSSIATLTFK